MKVHFSFYSLKQGFEKVNKLFKAMWLYMELGSQH